MTDEAEFYQPDTYLYGGKGESWPRSVEYAFLCSSFAWFFQQRYGQLVVSLNASEARVVIRTVLALF